MKHSHKNILVALMGQPNCGKSTVFNMLTGMHQHVANFPGVTVEKKQGAFQAGESRVEVIDLPGTYSLTSYSQEERVARDFILLQRPEVVVVVVDASNLERHLTLAFQVREMGLPMILCVNMLDVAERRGMRVDLDALRAALGVTVVAAVARDGIGQDDLQRSILDVCERTDHRPAAWRLDYGEALEPVLARLEARLQACEHLMEDFSARWLAVKILEEDAEARRIVLHHTHDGSGPAVLAEIDAQRARLAEAETRSPAGIIAARRHEQARAVAAQSVCRVRPAGRTRTDRVDMVVCHRIWGFACVALALYLAFTLTFGLAQEWHWIPWGDGWRAPTDIFAWFFEAKLPLLAQGMAAGPLRSLVEDGIIRGVGGVLEFLPVIFFRFVFLAILEDSGYVARIAFMLDRVLRRFGLPGNSVLPLVMAGGIAGGCAVPGVLATRSLRDERDRLATMLVAPFMCCGAKLPSLALLAAAFFAEQRAAMLWFMVALGWACALGAARALRGTVIRGEQTPLILELPPYHLPTARGVVRSAGHRSWLYMKKAGTVILAINVLLWAALYFPRLDAGTDPTEGQSDVAARQLHGSYAGRLGRFLEPLSRQAGFDWRDNIALIGGVAAKEVIVSVLSTAYSLKETETEATLRAHTPHPLIRKLRHESAWNPVRAFAFMIFILLYAPCLPTLVVIGRESGSWRWALFAVAYSTGLAFALAVLAFQAGSLLG